VSNQFTVRIGGDAYIDASGNLTFGTPSSPQVYQAPAGFSVDLSKLETTFKDLASILPSDDASKKKWEDWGVPAEIVNFLGSISGFVGVFASGLAAATWAIDALIFVMDLFGVGDQNGISPDLASALVTIQNQLRAGEEIDRANDLIKLQSKFDGALGVMSGKLLSIKTGKLTGDARANIFSDLRGLVDSPEFQSDLSELFHRTWDVSYDASIYSGRAFASELLVFQSSTSGQSPVSMAPPGLTLFDYRLGVPMLLYGATTFVGMAQVAVPWFRSAGYYARQLRMMADQIDSFVLRMQDNCLSRTEYTEDMVLQQQAWPIADVADPSSIPDPEPSIFRPGLANDIAVGAFDLVAYDDNFLADRFFKEIQAGQNTGPRGLFNYHWPIPDPSEDVDTAAAANEQSRQDYTNLQAATGMFRLIHTAAWLRFLSTPPTASETISGAVFNDRSLLDETPTIATSPPLPWTGQVIEHVATLKRFDASSLVQIRTLEPAYQPSLAYRVVLRMIDSLYDHEAWDKRGYVDHVWQADYEPAVGDPRLNRLKTQFDSGLVLSEIVLFEGVTPAEPYTRTGSATLRATTFDWYLPVVSPWSRFVVEPLLPGMISGTSSTASQQVIPGGTSLHLMSSHPMPETLPLQVSMIDNSSAVAQVLLDKAERRHVAHEDVLLTWRIEWNAGSMSVSLAGQPSDRPFQVQVVVEETVYSGETLSQDVADILTDQDLVETIHSVFPAEIANQVIYVPEEFFTEERDAIDQAEKALNEFNRRFSKNAKAAPIHPPVGPGDPMRRLLQSIQEASTRSLSTATLVTTLKKRMELASLRAPELWRAVVADVMSDRP
jgi:hypothetical protein